MKIFRKGTKQPNSVTTDTLKGSLSNENKLSLITANHFLTFFLRRPVVLAFLTAAGSKSLFVDFAVVAAVLPYLVVHFSLIPICHWFLVPSSTWLAFLLSMHTPSTISLQNTEIVHLTPSCSFSFLQHWNHHFLLPLSPFLFGTFSPFLFFFCVSHS